MAEYIEREAICRAYMDLCVAKSKLAKARKGAAFFKSDLLPETEPTTKELFRLVVTAPAADVAPVVHGRWIAQDETFTRFMCSHCKSKNHRGGDNYCPNCGAKTDLKGGEG